MKTNQQPTEHKTDYTKLEVHSVWPTIQGEGPYSGMPAVFVRLAGCNLQCPQCDTDYTSKRERLTAEEVVDLVMAVSPTASQLVVLTGGEPMRQNIAELCRLLIAAGYVVQIETNGTIFRKDLPYFDLKLCIVCSPKTPAINNQLTPFIKAYKYILTAGKIDEDGLPLEVLGCPFPPARPHDDMPLGTVYVQPLDEQDTEKNKEHMAATVDVCMRFGYRLCLQTHKIVGVP